MDYGNIPLIKAMHQKMNYLNERQGVLASNIANADTPGYRARDLKAPDFQAEMQSSSQKLAMARTNAKHISPVKAGGGFKEYAAANVYEVNPNENNVSIEDQVQKIAGNQSEYNRMTALYRKTTDMFKVAIGRPGA